KQRDQGGALLQKCLHQNLKITMEREGRNRIHKQRFLPLQGQQTYTVPGQDAIDTGCFPR
ncbi:hypothetical protein KIL84_018957, partial [Mauremys mutica]